METNQLPLVFAAQPKPLYLYFPVKTESELAEIRKAAAKKLAHLPRPSRHFDSPWGYQRSRNN